jgi:hypothetical protein
MVKLSVPASRRFAAATSAGGMPRPESMMASV